MFKKILIANRGEIACRVMRDGAAHGHPTVAVYSEADADALHVREADEAVRDRPAAAAESYLRHRPHRRRLPARPAPRRCIRATASCRRTPDFAAALEAAGIVFIGPPPAAIAAMGDKIESKKLAQQAGVSTVPGHLDTVADAEDAVAVAREIGYPVMIKAAAGGGGKGMRIAAQRCRAARRLPRSPRARRDRLRRRPRLHREIHRGAAPYRDPGARRRARQCRSISASANARSSAAIRR